MFHDSCMANGLDAAAPLLADLFHLLYAHTYRWGSEKSCPQKRVLCGHICWMGCRITASLRPCTICAGEQDGAAMEAARTVRQALSEAVQGIDRAAGRLLPVLERLTRRHDTAAERLYHLVRDAQADPARTPEALRAAAETASTAEQIQAVSGMIRDKLRKRQAETEAAAHTALQQGMDAALWPAMSGGAGEMGRLKMLRSRRSMTASCWTG